MLQTSALVARLVLSWADAGSCAVGYSVFLGSSTFVVKYECQHGHILRKAGTVSSTTWTKQSVRVPVFKKQTELITIIYYIAELCLNCDRVLASMSTDQCMYV